MALAKKKGKNKRKETKTFILIFKYYRKVWIKAMFLKIFSTNYVTRSVLLIINIDFII